MNSGYPKLSTFSYSFTEDNLKFDTCFIDSIKKGTSKDRLLKTTRYEPVQGAQSGWMVHKFGGSTFANPDSYTFVSGLVDSFPGKNLVVVSAMNGITNILYALCARANKEKFVDSLEWQLLTTRISDAIYQRLGDSSAGDKELRRFAADMFYLAEVLSYMSSANNRDKELITSLVVGYGEIWSARLLTQVMRLEHHRSAAFMDARDVLVVEPTVDDYIEVCWDITRTKLKSWWTNRKHCDVLIVTGFIARTRYDDLPTTLKRNGSDFSATIFSVLSKAYSVTVWKDVDGMYTADPKKHADAVFIPYQTYEEAEEASLRGAFVLQKDCIEPARQYNIPIFLRNCFNLSCPGTRIGNPEPEFSPSDSLEEEIFFMDDPFPCRSSSKIEVEYDFGSIPLKDVVEPVLTCACDSEALAQPAEEDWSLSWSFNSWA
eukprot:TRINITY_DN596_c0_g4_i1.p1 TRINITY_DN596_c0_g4~~TRINITY_DN596_c0_g4_i1.p1  ORF type:complete len:492 (-),score=75.97 TRINITY_DN596_c0_g4_i1:381-1673(-)